MIADDLAHHRSEVGRPLQVASGALEHRAVHTRLPGHRIRGPAVEDTTVGDLAGGVGAQPLDAPAGDIHDAGLGVVGAIVGILDGGATELREGHDHQVVPAALVGVAAEILAQGINRPPHPLKQVGMIARDPALVAVRVPAVDLGAGHERIGLVEHQRGRLELVEVAVGGGGDHVSGIGGSRGAGPVLGVGGREQVIRLVAVRVFAVHEGVAGFAEIDAREDLQRATHVLVLLLQEVPVGLVREGRPGGGLEGAGRLEIAVGGVGHPEQVVAGRVRQIGHRRAGSTQKERQRVLERDARQRIPARPARLDHRPIEHAVFDHGGPWGAGLPIGLRVEMRAGLLGVGHPVDEGQVTGIVDGCQEFQCGMQAGEPVAQRQRVRVGEGGSGGARLREQRLALDVPTLGGIDRDGDVVADLGAVGVVAVGNHVVEPVVGSAQEDEEQLLHPAVGVGLSEASLRERLLDEEGHIGQ